MEGILKIYHPEETLRYNIKSSYCKAVYSNAKNFLDVEIITDDDLEHVEDDSLQYNFPQLSIGISDFPIDTEDLVGKVFAINDTDEDIYCTVNLFDDEVANIYDNELRFSLDEYGELQLIWKGLIDDFYSNNPKPIPFKLKCNFKRNEPEYIED